MSPLAAGFPRQKRAPRVNSSKRRNLANRCDVLFSQLVRRVGRCEHCRLSARDLECAHGLPRRFKATRWDFRNAFCLCHDCHAYFTREPAEWDAWLVARLGVEFYAELRTIALAGVTEPLDDVWVRLRELERRAS